MRIGLISDTHIPEVAVRLPPTIRKAFQNVDLILHAGDIFALSVLNELESLAPVLAVCGDDDGPDSFRDKRMSDRRRIKLGAFCLGLQHVGPWLPPNKEEKDFTNREYKTTPLHAWYPDILVCGHTHKARIEKSNRVLIVNPGSATFPNYEKREGTVGLLTINSEYTAARLIQL